MASSTDPLTRRRRPRVRLARGVLQACPTAANTRHWGALALSALLAASACDADESRPGPLQGDPGSGGGASGTGGASAAGGSSGASGQSGSGGTQSFSCLPADPGGAYFTGLTGYGIEGVATAEAKPKTCGYVPAIADIQVHPLDGRILYFVGNEVRSLEHSGIVGEPLAWQNDHNPTVAMSTCPPDQPTVGFQLHPLTGAVVFRCPPAWVMADGTPLPVGTMTPRLLGVDGSVLGERALSLVIVRASGEEVPVTGFTAEVQGQGGNFVYGARAVDDGFWLAVRVTAGPFPRELWHVKLDGVATRLGGYPPNPAPIGDTPTGDVLDAAGRLYSVDGGSDQWLLVRRTVDGEAEVVVATTRALPPTLEFGPWNVFSGP